jgi:nitrogen fixation/metabolism regulation signal transduction histidine kinase
LDEGDFKDLVKVIGEETRHLNVVINEFDRYLHISSPITEKFDLARLLRTAIEDLQSREILDKKIGVRDEFPGELMVTGDSSQIEEAMRALLMNAAQALKDNDHSPLLAICPEESTSQVVFLIRDSGNGFTAESARRAMDPFYSTRPGATGLGLPLALALIENNGGTLEIMPPANIGEGACMRVTLNK